MDGEKREKTRRRRWLFNILHITVFELIVLWEKKITEWERVNKNYVLDSFSSV